MKGRSNRLPIIEPLDDWGDGSWTVDCSCGVNFDDGEEMVNCDECGVWVHTRCSQFLKGDTSFACDKCKQKKRENENEETEVAQLLVELPMKTMQKESAHCAMPTPRGSIQHFEIPMKERVHIHGVPGGDPCLFQTTPSVFTSQLWRCTGFIPKRFNFKYREFPIWDEQSDENMNASEVNENLIDKGADVLYSLSKETMSSIQTEKVKCLRVSVEGENLDKSFLKCPQTSLRENAVQLTAVYSSKKRKEESGTSKDQKLKNMSINKDKVIENRDIKLAIDLPKTESYQDSSTLEEMTTESVNTKKDDPQKDVKLITNNDAVNKSSENGVISNHKNSGNSSAVDSSIELLMEEEKDDPQILIKMGTSCETHDVERPVPMKAITGVSVKEEVISATIGGPNHLDIEDPCFPNLNVYGGITVGLQKSETKKADSHSSFEKRETGDAQTLGYSQVLISYDKEQKEDPPMQLCSREDIDTNATDLKSDDIKYHPTSETDKAIHGDTMGITEEKCERALEETSKPLKKVHEACSEPLHEQKSLDETQLSFNLPKLSTVPNRSLSSSPLVYTKLSNPDIQKTTNLAKQVVKLASDFEDKKNNIMEIAVKGESAKEIQRSLVKGDRIDLDAKPSHSSKNSHSSDSKEPQLSSSLKTHDMIVSILPEESGNIVQSQVISNTQNRIPHSISSQRCERMNQLGSQPLSDQELALLLHQELNSSPRVPRVPRVRQASIHQQISTPATSTHAKKSSTLGVKDHNSISKRKNKEDRIREFPHNAPESIAEGKRGVHLLSSDLKGKDTVTKDGSSKKETGYGSTEHLLSLKKALPIVSNSRLNHLSSPAAEASDQKPLRNEDSNSVAVHTHTLPSLLDEIMSKGRPITYEELCNMVLPHWNNLRKHNSNLCAYSSHSQAILDYLKNRNEWAYLIEDAPKTNPSERRKTDDDHPTVKSENEATNSDLFEDSKGKPKDFHNLESQNEDFPKGKRKSWKRRRLALQGKGLKEIRKRRKAERAVMEEDGTEEDSSTGRPNPVENQASISSSNEVESP